MFHEDVTYAADELKKLVGYQIVDTVVTEDGESYGFVVAKDGADKKACWVDCDPEGNGPGWISIQENIDGAETDTPTG